MHTIRRASLVLGITATLAARTSAEIMEGHELVRIMQEYEQGNALGAKRPSSAHFPTGKVMGFVMGVHDTLDEIAFCSPPGTNVGQLCAVVGKYLKDHPAEWNSAATVLVQKALAEAFPCPVKQFRKL